MCATRPNGTVWRAVIAVAALYALVLQGLLGGAIALRTLDATHALCLQASGVSTGDPSGTPPVHVHLSCCTAAVPMATAMPTLDTVAVVWPLRRAVRTAWRPEIVASPRAPPGVSASARAPPVA
ncbi:hypothetical protein [Methylobacterium gossipiicola]|uniref:DUF2946 domain-containing protein n=1 Tax=Methylobacterium gossipiicola TaxID=582675 RepID=A0A1I2WP87_9HYPH|nr:hypothetical protein [Methylobacterium gossipiicola]SFH02459.1 hypothetical protein SAMN05192565_1259 [Methylobacterium gossipiicola]